MSRTKEITEDLRKKKVIRLEKFTKPSLKSLDSTNPHSDRLCTNGGNSRPMLPSRDVVNQQRSLQGRISKVAKVSRVTFKQLKAFLTLAIVNVHEPTIRRTLSNHGVHGRVTRKSHCSPKRKLLAKDHVDKPEGYWRKV